MVDPKQIAQFCTRIPHLNSWLSRFVRHYMDTGTNFSYDIATNGEAWLIQTVGKLKPKIIVDVGANIGDWSVTAARQMPNTQVYSFEPNPPIFTELTKNTITFKNITCINKAVALTSGHFDLFIKTGQEQSGVSSLTKFAHHDTSAQISTIVGDDWMNEFRIEAIDLLKIDVEGYDLNVLKSFNKSLAARKIRVAQFEFATPNPFERIFLKDVYDFLTPLGYLIGRLYPTFVLFKSYSPTIRDEWWHGPNYVCCHQDDTEILTYLGNSSNRPFYIEYLTMN